MISSPERIVVHLVMRQWRLNVVAGIARLAEHQSGEVPLGIVMIAEAESVTPLVYHNVTNHVRAVSVWHRIQPPCVHVDVVIDDYVAFPDGPPGHVAVSYTHLRAHETRHDLVCRLLLEKKKQK